MAQLVFETFIEAIRTYEERSITNQETSVAVGLKLHVMGQATLLDKITNSDIGTKLWCMYETNRVNWEKLLNDSFQIFIENHKEICLL